MKNIFISRFIMALSVFLLVACGGVDDKQAVESAKEYIAKNQIREAGLELKNALQVNPGNAEARYLLGNINLVIGDIGAAEKEFRKAREAGWDEAQTQVGIMHTLVSVRDYKKVLEDIEIKEEYSREARADLYGLKAFAEAASGYAGLARASVVHGGELNPDSFYVLKTGVQLALADSKFDVGTEKLKRALSLYKNNTELLLLSAYIAMKSQDNAVAAEQFQRILTLEPKYLVTFTGRKARLGFARLEISSKNLGHAEKLLAPLFKQYANDPEVNYIGGLLSYEQANYDLAEERLLKVLKVVPEHAKSLLLYGAVNFAQKDFEQAAYYIGKYVQLRPEDVGARKLLGRVYIHLNRHEEAQAVLQTVLNEGGGDDAELLALVGLSQLQSGDIASGITDLEKALAVAPENKALMGELAKAYLSAGETERAIAQLNKILVDGGDRNHVEVMMVSAYLRAKQYDKAISTALDILERLPDDTAVMILVGNVFAASGDRTEARKYFDKVLKMEPENFQATMLLAKLEVIEGKYDRAATLYEKLNRSDSKSIDPLLALARLADQQRDNKKMVFWLEKARNKAPMDIRPRKILAEYYLQAHDLDKAEVLVKEATAISENDLDMLLIRGQMLMQQRLFNKAISPLTKLVTRKPESIHARLLLGEVHLYLHEMDDARRQLKLVLEREPYYAPALLVLARVEYATKQYAQAMEYVEKAIKVQPDLSQAYSLGGDISMSAGKYLAASQYYNKAMSIKPDTTTVMKLAASFNKMEQREKSVDLYRKWLKNNSDDASIRQLLGNEYLRNGDNKGAIDEFEVLYARQPENVAALNNLAWLYSLKNDSRALEFAEKAYKVKPDDSGVQDTYGWILVQNGEVEKGRLILEKAMRALSEVPEVRYHYAVALMKTGEEKKAREIFVNLLKSGVAFEGRKQVEELVK